MTEFLQEMLITHGYIDARVGPATVAPLMISSRYSPVPVEEFLELGGYIGYGQRGTVKGVKNWYITGDEAIELLKTLRPKLKGWRASNADTWINGHNPNP